MHSNRGFSLIELLIALIIITSAIITLNSIYKQYSSLRQKQSKYELIYISVLSLKDKLESIDLSRTFILNGTINGLKYTAKVKRVAQRRSFTFDFKKDIWGNFGKFSMTMYKITINMVGKQFEFYETQFKKIGA